MNNSRLIYKIKNYDKYREDFAIASGETMHGTGLALYHGKKKDGDFIIVVSETRQVAAYILRKMSTQIEYESPEAHQARCGTGDERPRYENFFTKRY